MRLWKIAEESQLVFRATPRPPRNGGEDMSRARAMLERDDTGSLDVCAMVDDEVWVTGSDGGALAVWSAQRKKPMFVLPNAHGRDVAIANAVESEGNEHGGENDVALATTTTSATSVYGTALHIHLDRDNADATHLSHVSADDVTSNPYWITAVAAMRHSDVVASGSSDGMVRLWRVNVKNEVEEDVHEDAHEADGDIENLEDNKSDDATATTAAHQFSLPTKPTRQQRRPMLEQIATAHVPGFINALAFAPSGTHLFAAVGQEHKLGRWEKVKRARNGVAVIPLQLK